MKVLMVTCILSISFLSQYWGKTYLVKTKDDTFPQRYEPEVGKDYGEDDDDEYNNMETIKSQFSLHDQKKAKKILDKRIDEIIEEEVGGTDYIGNLVPIFEEHAPALCEFGIELLTEVLKLKDLLDGVDVKKLCKAARPAVHLLSNLILGPGNHVHKG